MKLYLAKERNLSPCEVIEHIKNGDPIELPETWKLKRSVYRPLYPSNEINEKVLIMIMAQRFNKCIKKGDETNKTTSQNSGKPWHWGKSHGLCNKSYLGPILYSDIQ